MNCPILWLALCLSVSTLWGAWAGETPKIPGNSTKCDAGMETGTWKLEEWGNTGKVEMVDAGLSRALKIAFKGGNKEKVAISQQTSLNFDPNGEVRLHVYAPDQSPPQVAIYFLVGEASDWHEAKPFKIEKGWNKLAVTLAAPNWKTAGTKWAFKTGVERADDVRGVGLIVMNGSKTGWLAVQGFAVDASAASKEVEALARKLLSEDGEERAQAEKALAEIGRPAVPALRRLKNHERPEVALRAGWALDKIEARLEEERRAEEAKRLAAKAFMDARERARKLLKELNGTKAELQRLASDAREELLRARKTVKDLKAPSEADRQAYEELLQQLDDVSRETLRQVGTREEQPAGEAKQTE